MSDIQPTAKKIACFISSLSAGGAERVCSMLANHWASHRWAVTVITLADPSTDFYLLDSAVSRRMVPAGLRQMGAGSGVVVNLRRVLGLRRLLQETAADFAISFMDSNNVLLALASLGARRTIPIGTEHVYPPQVSLGPAWSTLRRLTYGKLWAVVALTHESSTWLSQHTGAARVPVIPNPVQWPLSPGAHRSLPPAKGKGRLLCVGRLTRQKGFDLLLPCFARLAAEFHGWDLVIVGEGPERASLERAVETLGLCDRVFLPGVVGNIGDWYATADVFVMPSRFEGFPMTLVEAMASGVPSVSFDCLTGPRAIIRDGIDGILVPDGDTHRLETELEALMRDFDRRVLLGQRAIEVRTRFSIESIGTLWDALFDEALVHRWGSV
jgi:glycosyltransferase involved in cell wall biosynthesis